MARACNTYWGEKKCIQSFGGETRGKEIIQKTYARREANIKMDLHETGYEMWTGLILAQVAGLCKHAN